MKITQLTEYRQRILNADFSQSFSVPNKGKHKSEQFANNDIATIYRI